MKFNFFILLFVYLIKIYQYFISPLIGQNCRYLPTCSEYSIQSLKQHGIIKGTLYSIKRISRCHPLGGHGFDPVPKNKKEKII
tara:strand:+ start:1100 stop:1348 length:249 start_codon:yes stop_codon:yes gene_type:complete